MAEEIDVLEEHNEDEGHDDILADAPKEKSSLVSKLKTNAIPIGIGVVVILVVLFFLVFNKSETKDPVENSNLLVTQEKKKEEPKKKKKIKYIRLFSQLESGDSAQVLKQLSLNKINFTIEQTGQKYTILVDQDQLELARNILALKGVPSGSAPQGYELLDDAQTLGVTEFDKRVRFLRAISGELEIAILQLEMIESCKVQIVLPEQRLFTVTQPPVTAAILIRLFDDREVTDEIVYSIIQLVASAVENLQPENVSVVDTFGTLLSDGIFERIAAKRSGEFQEEQKQKELEKKEIQTTISREEALGYPIIPNYKAIQEWFDIKWQYEKEMSKKSEKQLVGILPVASYKVAITSDIGPIENGQVVDIKRQTISVVIDGLNDEIYLDTNIKQQIFSTIAGTVGYIKGRDSIQLSVADFPLFTEDEKNKIKNEYKGHNLFYYLFAAMLFVFLIGFSTVLFFFTKKLILDIKSKIKHTSDESTSDDDASLLATVPLYDNSNSISKFQTLSNEDPKLIANLMNQFLKEDEPEPTENDTSNLNEDTTESEPITTGEM